MNVSTVTNYRQSSEDYLLIEQAIEYLEKNSHRQPELAEIAGAVGLSEFHFQRVFTRWAGISPKRFLQFLTKENAKQLLAQSENLLDTTLQVGLSSLGRLHDLFVTTEAVTPGEYKSLGAGVTIRYGLHPTPFGECLIGVTERGICHLGFVQDSEGGAIDELVADWKQARMIEDHDAITGLIEPIFDLGRRQAHADLVRLGATLVAHHPSRVFAELHGAPVHMHVLHALAQRLLHRVFELERRVQELVDLDQPRLEIVGGALRLEHPFGSLECCALRQHRPREAVLPFGQALAIEVGDRAAERASERPQGDPEQRRDERVLLVHRDDELKVDDAGEQGDGDGDPGSGRDAGEHDEHGERRRRGAAVGADAAGVGDDDKQRDIDHQGGAEDEAAAPAETAERLQCVKHAGQRHVTP